MVSQKTTIETYPNKSGTQWYAMVYDADGNDLYQTAWYCSADEAIERANHWLNKDKSWDYTMCDLLVIDGTLTKLTGCKEPENLQSISDDWCQYCDDQYGVDDQYWQTWQDAWKSFIESDDYEPRYEVGMVVKWRAIYSFEAIGQIRELKVITSTSEYVPDRAVALIEPLPAYQHGYCLIPAIDQEYVELFVDAISEVVLEPLETNKDQLSIFDLPTIIQEQEDPIMSATPNTAFDNLDNHWDYIPTEAKPVDDQQSEDSLESILADVGATELVPVQDKLEPVQEIVSDKTATRVKPLFFVPSTHEQFLAPDVILGISRIEIMPVTDGQDGKYNAVLYVTGKIKGMKRPERLSVMPMTDSINVSYQNLVRTSKVKTYTADFAFQDFKQFTDKLPVVKIPVDGTTATEVANENESLIGHQMIDKRLYGITPTNVDKQQDTVEDTAMVAVQTGEDIASQSRDYKITSDRTGAALQLNCKKEHDVLILSWQNHSVVIKRCDGGYYNGGSGYKISTYQNGTEVENDLGLTFFNSSSRAILCAEKYLINCEAMQLQQPIDTSHPKSESAITINHDIKYQLDIDSCQQVANDPDLTERLFTALDKSDKELADMLFIEAVQPEVEATTEAEAVQPEVEATTEAEAVQPEVEATTEAEAVQPEVEATTEAEAVQPEAEAVQTEAEAVQPEVEAVQTEAEAVQPEVEAVQTEVEAVQTEAEAVQSEVEAVQTVGANRRLNMDAIAKIANNPEMAERMYRAISSTDPELAKILFPSVAASDNTVSEVETEIKVEPVVEIEDKNQDDSPATSKKRGRGPSVLPQDKFQQLEALNKAVESKGLKIVAQEHGYSDTTTVLADLAGYDLLVNSKEVKQKFLDGLVTWSQVRQAGRSVNRKGLDHAVNSLRAIAKG